MVNKIILIGNLGKDARKIEQGHDFFVGLSVATNISYKDKNGEWVKKVTWHDCIHSGKSAEFSLGLKKGQQIYIEGSYLSKKGNDREKFVKIHSLKKVGGQSEPDNSNNSNTSSEENNYY